MANMSIFGGKPSKGTSADRRLKGNKNLPPKTKPAPKPKQPTQQQED